MRGFLETTYGKTFPQGSGDVVRIRIGDIVPADIEIVEGEFDESALTGESLPVEKKTGDTAYSDSICRRRELLVLLKQPL